MARIIMEWDEKLYELTEGPCSDDCALRNTTYCFKYSAAFGSGAHCNMASLTPAKNYETGYHWRRIK